MVSAAAGEQDTVCHQFKHLRQAVDHDCYLNKLTGEAYKNNAELQISGSTLADLSPHSFKNYNELYPLIDKHTAEQLAVKKTKRNISWCLILMMQV